MPWKEHWTLKLRRRFRKPFNRLVHRDYFVSRYLGAAFLLPPEGIGTLEISAGISERQELSYFMARCHDLKPSLFIDIGANIGMYSCILLKNACAPRAVLFEPDIENQARLGANLLMNGLLQKVDLHRIALGDKPGSFHLLPGETDGGFSRIVDEACAGSYEVKVERLDDVLAVCGQQLAIKIDVEGFERRVLSGMQRTLRENRCLVQIEAFEPGPIIGVMTDAGYKLVKDFLPNYVFENY